MFHQIRGGEAQTIKGSKTFEDIIYFDNDTYINKDMYLKGSLLFDEYNKSSFSLLNKIEHSSSVSGTETESVDAKNSMSIFSKNTSDESKISQAIIELKSDIDKTQSSTYTYSPQIKLSVCNESEDYDRVNYMVINKEEVSVYCYNPSTVYSGRYTVSRINLKEDGIHFLYYPGYANSEEYDGILNILRDNSSYHSGYVQIKPYLNVEDILLRERDTERNNVFSKSRIYCSSNYDGKTQIFTISQGEESKNNLFFKNAFIKFQRDLSDVSTSTHFSSITLGIDYNKNNNNLSSIITNTKPFIKLENTHFLTESEKKGTIELSADEIKISGTLNTLLPNPSNAVISGDKYILPKSAICFLHVSIKKGKYLKLTVGSTFSSDDEEITEIMDGGTYTNYNDMTYSSTHMGDSTHVYKGEFIALMYFELNNRLGDYDKGDIILAMAK